MTPKEVPHFREIMRKGGATDAEIEQILTHLMSEPARCVLCGKTATKLVSVCESDLGWLTLRKVPDATKGLKPTAPPTTEEKLARLDRLLSVGAITMEQCIKLAQEIDQGGTTMIRD